MTIVEILKSEELILRISNGDRWLVWDNELNCWRIYERRHKQRYSRTIIQTQSEEEAVNELLK